MERLRDDEGLGGILGYQPPAPETARQWLDRFHDEAMMTGQPSESKSLVDLNEVNRRLIRTYVENI